MKYAFIERNKSELSIGLMSKVLEVSRSGYYDWLSNRDKVTVREQNRQVIDKRVKDAFVSHRGRSGSPRITEELKAEGDGYNEKTVANSMTRQGLKAKAGKKFKATTNSKHNLPVADNVLGQNFTANNPNEKWVSDITYLWTEEGWLYLAVIVDLYSRCVVGWSMSERMTADLVCDALTMALWNRQMPKGVIIHSDRGSQYCSNAYQQLLNKHGLICSMSGKGNCYDNACAESFFHSLKVEALHGERFVTRQAMREEVFEYIEIYYNRKRLHSANGYVSPVGFEQQSA